MSEAKWSITEAKCLQISHNKFASQRDAISHSMGNLMLSHSAGMHNTDKSIAGISKRFHFASLHYIFSAYLPTHIKFLTEFHRIFFGTTCISFLNKMISWKEVVSNLPNTITPQRRDMPSACFQCVDTLLITAKHAKGMSLRYDACCLTIKRMPICLDSFFISINDTI